MHSNPFHNVRKDEIVTLESTSRFGQAGHRWGEHEIDALTFAAAARRPLLVRGEAGCGKSQIARAAAKVTRGELFCEVIHPRFEALDLLYRFDVVERLADAQVNKLDDTNDRYVKRGELWLAMERVTATGPLPVLLIDEIDKADADVPNALLDVLGNRSFKVPQLKDRTISPAGGRMPLVVITTNEERELPPAFVRRCAVLNLNPPKDDASFEQWLVLRSEAHESLKEIDTDVRKTAAAQVLTDRRVCEREGYPAVGLAEFIDLLHALQQLTRGLKSSERRTAQFAWLEKLDRYALVKQPRQEQSRESVPPRTAAPEVDPR